MIVMMRISRVKKDKTNRGNIHNARVPESCEMSRKSLFAMCISCPREVMND